MEEEEEVLLGESNIWGNLKKEKWLLKEVEMGFGTTESIE